MCNINHTMYTKTCAETKLSAILIIHLLGCENICKHNCTVFAENERKTAST